jgi:hypothetical protein
MDGPNVVLVHGMREDGFADVEMLPGPMPDCHRMPCHGR